MTAPIPENLKALKSAAVAAQQAYHGHKFTGDQSDTDAVIAYDIEDKRLLSACTRAQIAYEDALNAYLASEAA